MIVRYVWPDDLDTVPAIGTPVEVSGDPDKPVLKGEVTRVFEDGQDHPEMDAEDSPVLHISMVDGQNGAADFMQWIMSENTLGVRLAQPAGP